MFPLVYGPATIWGSSRSVYDFCIVMVCILQRASHMENTCSVCRLLLVFTPAIILLKNALLWGRFQRIITFAQMVGYEGGMGRYWKGTRGSRKGETRFDPLCLPLSHAKAIKMWVYMSVTRTILKWFSLWLFTAGAGESPLHWELAFLLTPNSLLDQRGLTAFICHTHCPLSDVSHLKRSMYLD